MRSGRPPIDEYRRELVRDAMREKPRRTTAKQLAKDLGMTRTTVHRIARETPQDDDGSACSDFRP